MTRSHPEITAQARRKAASATLSGLMIWMGEAGLAAAKLIPGLRAELDQHTAAIIDALCDDGHVLGPIALAGYASGVRDGATEHGWTAPDIDRLDWCRADWAVVRLVAVCDIARAAAYA